MNCKHLDTVAGFMYAYSYCPSKDLCQADVWNYLTIMCDQGWMPGMGLDLDENCKVNKNNISISYQSLPSMAGQTISKRASLIAGSSFDINIDATQFVARVLINNTNLVGVLYGRWKFDYWLVIP